MSNKKDIIEEVFYKDAGKIMDTDEIHLLTLPAFKKALKIYDKKVNCATCIYGKTDVCISTESPIAYYPLTGDISLYVRCGYWRSKK